MPRLVLALAVALAAQAVFRTSVDLVHLDVSVLDKNRKPVTGLTEKDFTILEDGQPRAVAAFAALTVKAPPPPMSSEDTWVQRVSADVQTNEFARTPEGRLFVLVLDDGLTPQDPAATSTAKDIAKTVINRLSPGDQMAVVFTVGSKGSQSFTSDREKLLKAASTFAPGYARHMMGWDTAGQEIKPDGTIVWKVGPDNDAQYREGAVRTLENVAASLIAAPQRRKAIIYVSPGVFADLDASAPALARQGQSMMNRQANSSLNTRLPDLYRRMREGNVTIYTIDPMGLGGLESYVQRTAPGFPAFGQAKNHSSMADWYAIEDPPLPPLLAHRMAYVSLDFLKAAAENTGGLAITDTNDLVGGVERILQENASYYLLGFSVPPGHRAGSLHRLQIKVNRSDVTVRARSGYTVPELPAQDKDAAPGAPAKSGPSAAVTALAGPVPAGPLPMRAALAPFASTTPGKGDPVVAIALGLEHLVTRDTPQTFEVELRALTQEGGSKLGERRTGQATLRAPQPGGDAFFDLLATIALPPGRYEVRFGANLTPANLAGALFADLEVPDFVREPVSLSGVLMETDIGQAGPLDALTGLSPVVPSSKRAFTTYDRPQAFVRVYQGGKDPLANASIRVTIHDRDNQLVFNNRFPLQIRKFDAQSRSTDFKFPLPLAALRSGPYLLSFEAALGERVAKRQVKFTFR